MGFEPDPSRLEHIITVFNTINFCWYLHTYYYTSDNPPEDMEQGTLYKMYKFTVWIFVEK